MLFYGPPGTGKTSTILAMARKIYGDNFRQNVLEVSRLDWEKRWIFLRDAYDRETRDRE